MARWIRDFVSLLGHRQTGSTGEAQAKQSSENILRHTFGLRSSGSAYSSAAVHRIYATNKVKKSRSYNSWSIELSSTERIPNRTAIKRGKILEMYNPQYWVRSTENRVNDAVQNVLHWSVRTWLVSRDSEYSTEYGVDYELRDAAENNISKPAVRGSLS